MGIKESNRPVKKVNTELLKVDKIIENIKWIISITAIVSALCFCSIISIFFLFTRNKSTTDIQSLGLSGDFLGGILGTLISGITIYLVWRTYRLQETELKLTRKHLAKQQFETTFFTMLNMIHSLSKDFKPKQEGGNFFKEFIDELKSENLSNVNYGNLFNGMELDFTEVRNRIFLKLIAEEGNKFYSPGINDINVFKSKYIGDFISDFKNWKDEDIKNEEKFMGHLYLEFFLKYDSDLGHFFRYIYNTILFTIKERKELGDDVFYINLIQAQLSNYQLAVMFYNCISTVSFNSKEHHEFKDILDNYGVFQNLPSNLLLDHRHQGFYCKTIFKH